MQLKKLLLNTMWFGVVPKLSLVITVIVMPLITPFLDARDYGIVGVISSFTSVFASVCTLGLNVHLTNSYYEFGKNFNLVWGRILFLLILSGAISALLLSLTLLLAIPEIPPRSLLIVIFLSSSPLLLGVNALLANHLYPLRYDPKRLVIPVLIANIVGILTSFVLIRFFRMGYIGLLASTTVSSFLTFLLFIKPIWIDEKIIPVIDRNFKRVRNMIRISLPVIPHTLGFMLLSSSDRLLMKIYNIPITDIGYYTNGYSMGDYMTVITAALITALSPKIQELYRSSSFDKLRKVYFLSQVFTALAVSAFALWMPEIYRILVRNEDLQQCGRIASLICFSNIVYPLYALLSTVAFIEKKTLQLLWLVFVPGLLNIILNLIFMPVYGYEAAIYVKLGAYWSLLLIPFLVGFYKEIFLKIFVSRPILFYKFLGFLFLLVASNYLSLLSTGLKILISAISLLILWFYFNKNKEYILDF